MEDDEENFIAYDFHTLVYDAQHAELVLEEKRREEEREKARELAQQNNPSAMSLMQIAGLRSQKELDKEAAEKTSQEVAQDKVAEQRRKDEENERLVARFPYPDL